jgi:hypothetical protein
MQKKKGGGIGFRDVVDVHWVWPGRNSSWRLVLEVSKNKKDYNSEM